MRNILEVLALGLPFKENFKTAYAGGFLCTHFRYEVLVRKFSIKEIEQRIKELERETKNIKPNLDVLLSKLDRIFALNPEEANRILKLFAQEIEIVSNNGIVQIRVKKGSALPKILTKRLVAGAGFEPATSGL